MKEKALILKRILAALTSAMILTAASTGCSKDSDKTQKQIKIFSETILHQAMYQALVLRRQTKSIL